MFPLTQQVPAHVSEGGDEDEDDGGEGQGDIFRIMESGGYLIVKNGQVEYYTLFRASNHRFSERWLSLEGRPAHTFSTLISSSKSGQWMPSPRPMRRQLLRS